MPTAFGHITNYNSFKMQVSVTVLLCLSAFIASPVNAKKDSAAQPQRVSSLSSEDIIAELHRRGIDPNKSLKVIGSSALTQQDKGQKYSVPEIPYTLKPLTGLKGFWVCIEDIAPDAKKDGLDPHQIKVEVELRLRKAGIPIFDKINSDGNDTMAALDVNIKASKDDTGLYRYSLLVEATESVALLRSPQCFTSAATWSTISYGTVGGDKMAASLEQEVNDAVDRLANVYLAQNPK